MALQQEIMFPIVGLVTTLSLLLAFLSNRKPIHKFRLQTKKYFNLFPAESTLKILFCLSFGLILSPYFLLLPYIAEGIYQISGYLFQSYEPFLIGANLCGALILAIVLLDTIIISFLSTAKYTKHNFALFVKSVNSLILEGNEDDLASLGKELRYSFKEIIRTAGEYSRIEAYRLKKTGKGDNLPEITLYSIDLLNVLSDSRFCKIFVTRCSSSFFHLISEIQNNSLYRKGGYSFVQNLFKYAFTLEDSLLSREKDYDGYGHFKDLTKLVFSNSEFLFSFHIFSAFPSFYTDNVMQSQVRKFTDCVKVALISSIEKPNEYDIRYLLNVTNVLNDLVSNCVRNINKDSQQEYNSQSGWILSEVSQCLCKILDVIGEHGDKLPDFDLNVEELAKHRYDNIYMIIADAIRNFLSKISYKGSNDEFFRPYSIDIWQHLFSYSESNQALIKIAKSLEYLFYDDLINIEKSLLQGNYAGTVLKSLLTLFFPHLPNKSPSDELEVIGNRILNRAYKILYTHFVTQNKRNPQITMAYIPSHIEYDEKNKTLKIKDWKGEYIIFNLIKNNEME